MAKRIRFVSVNTNHVHNMEQQINALKVNFQICDEHFCKDFLVNLKEINWNVDSKQQFRNLILLKEICNVFAENCSTENNCKVILSEVFQLMRSLPIQIISNECLASDIVTEISNDDFRLMNQSVKLLEIFTGNLCSKRDTAHEDDVLIVLRIVHFLCNIINLNSILKKPVVRIFDSEHLQ